MRVRKTIFFISIFAIVAFGAGLFKLYKSSDSDLQSENLSSRQSANDTNSVITDLNTNKSEIQKNDLPTEQEITPELVDKKTISGIKEVNSEALVVDKPSSAKKLQTQEAAQHPVPDHPAVTTAVPPSTFPDALTVEAGLSMTGISAVDKSSQATATFYSPSDLYLNVKYRMDFEDDFGIAFFAAIKRHHFSPVQSANKSLDSADVISQSFGIGFKKKSNPETNISANVKYETRLFARGMTSQIVSIDPVPMPILSVGYERRVLNKDPKSLWLGASASYLGKSFSGASSADVGSEFAIWIKGDRKLDQVLEKSIEIELGLKRRLQNSDIVTQTEYQTYLGFSYNFDPFK